MKKLIIRLLILILMAISIIQLNFFSISNLGLEIANSYKNSDTYDIVVYGGTSAGVVAAIQAARLGRKVVLIAQGNHIGGMTTSGLGLSDIGDPSTIGGITKEFYQRIFQYYQNPRSHKVGTSEEYLQDEQLQVPYGGDMFSKMQWIFEPHVAEKIFNDMLRQSGATVIYGQRLDLKNGVIKNGLKIQAVKMESGRTFAAKVFIDASYEGDLMAEAGVSNFIGRESNSEYGETLNGSRAINDEIDNDNSIDPFIIKGDSKSGLLPNIQSGSPVNAGDPDHRIQAYNFRLCLTEDTNNRVPFVKPANYNPLLYELLARYFKVNPDLTLDSILTLTPLPNMKFDANNKGPFSTDFIGKSYDWPEGDYITRDRIWQEHKDYIQGLLWFLENDSRVPERIRLEVSKFGLSKDEFGDNGNWPYQLYVREARRMVGEFVMTENVCKGKQSVNDPIGLGSYMMDSHEVTLYSDKKGRVREEGGFGQSVSPYPISYRALLPKSNECINLLVPICLSATHVAFGSIRMEPVFMMLAQSSAIAADIAIKKAIPLQAVPYETLRNDLTNAGQIFDLNVLSNIKQSGFLKQLEFLMNQKLISSLGYWTQNTVDGKTCNGELVAELIIQTAGKFKHVNNIREASEVLKDEGIISSINYWNNNSEKDGDAVRLLINSIAEKLIFDKYYLKILGVTANYRSSLQGTSSPLDSN